jgi:ribosome recycling factor
MHSIIKEAESQMQKRIESFKAEIAKLRTGRAHPSLLEHIRIDYYGSMMPISQVANVNVTDARTLTISPWEKGMLALIEKAIINSDLGLNPATTGNIIRVPMPALNEERRKELIKVVRHEAETGRVNIRNVRREANDEIKALLKAKTLTEDEERRLQDEVQKLTNKYVAEVDQLLATKEAELLAI